jgi:pimeloyl-ACP methyl ester carboxylesterase
MTKFSVDGFEPVDMHFLHQNSDISGAIRLLFVHGWPGSFLEVTKILPLLKGGDGKPAFHVVVPSLPNYVFSGWVMKVCCFKSGQCNVCGLIKLIDGRKNSKLSNMRKLVVSLSLRWVTTNMVW